MSSNPKRVQQRFESLFGGNNTNQWRQAKSSIVTSKQLSKSEATLFENDLKLDSLDLYFKGLLSLSEAINSINNHLYSWATIKLYYSVFYFLSCSLACYGIALVRRMRELYYVKAKYGELFHRTRDNTDHKGTIFLFQDLFNTTDKLQTNQITGENVYEWLMKRREEVNYKDREFHEPTEPDFWVEISRHVKSGKFEDLIETYINDNQFIYCFIDDHACLAMPIKRMQLTKMGLINNVTTNILTNDKKTCIEQLLLKSNTKLHIINEFIL